MSDGGAVELRRTGAAWGGASRVQMGQPLSSSQAEGAPPPARRRQYTRPPRAANLTPPPRALSIGTNLELSFFKKFSKRKIYVFMYSIDIYLFFILYKNVPLTGLVGGSVELSSMERFSSSKRCPPLRTRVKLGHLPQGSSFTLPSIHKPRQKGRHTRSTLDLL